MLPKRTAPIFFLYDVLRNGERPTDTFLSPCGEKAAQGLIGSPDPVFSPEHKKKRPPEGGF